ncbi:MAG: alpha/beta hydrolase [Elusimicrobia bacterium]|nr:alpha/beta hydrolase [Elusimicrobiota bacterium]
MDEINVRPSLVAGARIHCLSGGQGEPVVLLHGLGASSYTWRHLLPSLARTHAVYAPDFPGYGRSDKPRDFDYSLGGFAAWLRTFLTERGLPAAALIGNSMGGAVALRLALDEPRLVRRLVLIGAPVFLNNVPQMVRIMRRPLLGRLLELFLGRWTVRLVAATAFLDPALITKDVIDEYSLAFRTRAGRRATAETLRRCLSPDLDGYIARYGTLQAPLLFIRGDHDGVVDDESARRFCGIVPNGRLLRIPRCGHVPQEEKPEAVRTALEAFL